MTGRFTRQLLDEFARALLILSSIVLSVLWILHKLDGYYKNIFVKSLVQYLTHGN